MTLRAHFTVPKAGWIDLELSAPEASVSIEGSYTPRDSVSELAVGSLSLIEQRGAEVITVVFSAEPAECDLSLHPEPGGIVLITVTSFVDYRRDGRTGELLWSMRVPLAQAATSFWRALRDLADRLSAEEYERAWRHPYPATLVAQLGAAIESTTGEGTGAA